MIPTARIIADLVDHSELEGDDRQSLIDALTIDVYFTHRVDIKLADDRTLTTLTMNRDDDGCREVSIIAIYDHMLNKLESIQYIVDSTLRNYFITLGN